MINDNFKDLFSDFSCTRKINRENLFKILSDNKNTEFGKRHGFKSITSLSEYQSAVPVSGYSDYESLLTKENGVTAYPVKTILTTSGTTSGKQKEFPITYESLNRYSDYVFMMPFRLMGEKNGPHLHISVFRPEAGGKTIMSAAYYNHILENRIIDTNAFVGGRDLMYSSSITDVAYVKAYLALSCKNLVSFHSIFLYDILSLMSYIEQNWKNILSDMKNGRVSADLDEATKAELLKNQPDKARIVELEAELSKGFDGDTVSKIWKNLRFAVGIGGGVYLFQETQLKRYLGNIPIYYTIFASSECMMGIATQMNKAEYALLPRNAFYEFINQDGKIVQLEDLETGGVYEPVLTTFSGLYRYRMCDRLRITSFVGEAPVFLPIGRTDDILNIAGEKLDENVARETVTDLIDELGLRANDFAFGIDTSVIPNGYCLFLETETPLPQGCADLLDEKLKKSCPDYKDVRSLKMLSSPKVFKTAKGAIADTYIRTRKAQSHNKPKIFLDVPHTTALIKAGKLL